MMTIKQEMQAFLQAQDWDYFVTANLNRSTNWHGARRLLKDWHARIDSQIVGPRWRQKTSQRTRFVAFYEGAQTNEHWHMLLKLNGKHRDIFSAEAPVIWQRLVPSGSLDIRPVLTRTDQHRISGYVVKDLWKDMAQQSFVLSEEFCS